jgi:hypothetical protein
MLIFYLPPISSQALIAKKSCFLNEEERGKKEQKGKKARNEKKSSPKFGIGVLLS